MYRQCPCSITQLQVAHSQRSLQIQVPGEPYLPERPTLWPHLDVLGSKQLILFRLCQLEMECWEQDRREACSVQTLDAHVYLGTATAKTDMRSRQPHQHFRQIE